MVGKELVAVELLLYGSPLDELTVECKHPTVVLPPCAVILLAAYLSWR